MNPKIGIQIIAAFMIISMVLSSVIYFIGDDSSDNGDIQSISTVTEDYFNVGGKLVFHNFKSITDGLQMSTPNVTSALFVDVDYINYTASQTWHEQLSYEITTVIQLLSSQVDDLYQSSTLQMYYAQLPDDEMILLSTMSPKKTPDSFMPAYSNNGQYIILERSFDFSGFNVMGEPTIYTNTRDTAEEIITIVESWVVPSTGYDIFLPVLNHSDEYSEYQAVNSQVAFADLYYIGIHRNDDDTFTRTTVYLNASDGCAAHINELAQSGSERGFSQYDVTLEGDILKVMLTGEFSLVNAEDIQ
ncbi:MAG: hypothetical protein C5S43_03135 [Candidatus Methanocomedens sp.]|nr:MAG: hypothetical protein C5S43_03135 [ANME-2 cluster archaeon]